MTVTIRETWRKAWRIARRAEKIGAMRAVLESNLMVIPTRPWHTIEEARANWDMCLKAHELLEARNR